MFWTNSIVFSVVMIILIDEIDEILIAIAIFQNEDKS